MKLIATLAALTLALPPTAIAQPSGVKPGLWEIAVTINSMDSPSLPPAIAKMMIGKTVTVKHCITPADAAKGPQEMLKSGSGCVFNKYTMAAGRMNSEITCTSHGATTRTASSGTFTPESFTAQGRAVATGGAPMTTTSTSVGRRIGGCK